MLSRIRAINQAILQEFSLITVQQQDAATLTIVSQMTGSKELDLNFISLFLVSWTFHPK